MCLQAILCSENRRTAAPDIGGACEGRAADPGQNGDDRRGGAQLREDQPGAGPDQGLAGAVSDDCLEGDHHPRRGRQLRARPRGLRHLHADQRQL